MTVVEAETCKARERQRDRRAELIEGNRLGQGG